MAKRLLDMMLSGGGLIVSAPLWAVIAALIKIEDGGPVFFSQERVGRGGRRFDALKFRSMIVDAEARTGPIQSGENDPRITRIGRLLRATAMDELPQLWNIFRGDMSFVGPRALRPGEIEVKGNGIVEKLEDVPGFADRCAVRPGTDRRRADLRAARCRAAPQVPLRPFLHPPAVVLLRCAAHPPVVLDYVPRAVGGPRPQVVRSAEGGRMPAMHDVVIIGGGPAGLYAGARLAAAGFQTTLLEEHASVGEPVHCTGVLAADAFDEFNLSRRSLLNQLTTARFRSPAGHEVMYTGDRVEAVVIDRRAFDQDLLDRATSAGVVIERGARVTGVQVDAERRHRHHARRPSTARVRASSRAAPTMRCTGRSGSTCRGCSSTPRSSSCAASRLGDVELHFGAEIAPKGFGWVVPVMQAARAVRARSASCATATRRGIFSASPPASSRDGGYRRRSRPPAPEDSSARADFAHVRRSAARHRRCGGSGEADDRRGNLLQPRLGCARGRDACRCGVAERPQRAAGWPCTSSDGASACQRNFKRRPGCACSRIA